MKSVSKALWDLLSSIAAFMWAITGPPSAVILPDNHVNEKPTRSPTEWLQSRGYRDSFGHDDEIEPDAKEDVLLIDEVVN